MHDLDKNILINVFFTKAGVYISKLMLLTKMRTSASIALIYLPDRFLAAKNWKYNGNLTTIQSDYSQVLATTYKNYPDCCPTEITYYYVSNNPNSYGITLQLQPLC